MHVLTFRCARTIRHAPESPTGHPGTILSRRRTNTVQEEAMPCHGIANGKQVRNYYIFFFSYLICEIPTAWSACHEWWRTYWLQKLSFGAANFYNKVDYSFRSYPIDFFRIGWDLFPIQPCSGSSQFGAFNIVNFITNNNLTERSFWHLNVSKLISLKSEPLCEPIRRCRGSTRQVGVRARVVCSWAIAQLTFQRAQYRIGREHCTAVHEPVCIRLNLAMSSSLRYCFHRMQLLQSRKT